MTDISVRRIEFQFDKATANFANLKASLTRTADDLGVPVELPSIPSGTPTSTVVVVGEPKSGKSSLVNALVEHPNLSPVDYAVATATYIVIRRGTAGARVFPEGYDAPEEIHIDELPAWTSESGLAQNPRAPCTPKPVDVTLPATLLEGLTIVDTPGVGGFDTDHDRATLAALGTATTLLFVVDGARPISEPELAFLEQATERVAALSFVLTKIDQVHEWEAVLADCRAKIAERVPTFADAPWFPVSATLAETAGTANLPPDAARALREQSRLDDLLDHLRTDVAGQARAFVAANAYAALLSTARALEATAERRTNILEDPSPEAGARLQAEADELAKLSSKEDAWRTRLDLNLSTARSAALLDVDRFVRASADGWTKLAKDRAVGPGSLADTVNRGIAETSDQFLARFEERIEAEVREIVGDAAGSPAFTAALSAASESREVVALREERDLVSEGRLQPAQTMQLALSGTGALSLTIGVAGLSVLPGVGIAVAVIASSVAFARRQAKVNERMAWVNSRLAEAKIDLQAMIDNRVLAGKALVQNAVRDWSRAKRAELEASSAALKAQSAATRAEQQRAVEAAKATAANLATAVDSCTAWITHFRRGLWSTGAEGATA